MRRYLCYMVIRWLLRGSVLSYVVRARRSQLKVLSQWTRRFARLSRLLPSGTACQEISRAFSVIPADAAVSLAREASDICIQDKQTLLFIAQTLAFHSEYDEAQTLLWRGVRLYEKDNDVWECALRISLERLLSCVSFVEQQQAYHRFKYLTANIPSDTRQHPTIAPYLTFGLEEGRYLSEALSFCLWLWQRGKVGDAREGLRLWWTKLQSQGNVPELALRLAVWYMVGLGMFDEIVHDPSVQHLPPDIVAVVNWFLGSPLPHYPKGSTPHLLLLLAQWSQCLTSSRRPPVAVMWRLLLTARRRSETFIIHVLLAATLGVRHVALRQRFISLFAQSGLERFLPYLHFLCIATARLRWEAETREIWLRINQMDVEYARREDLREFLSKNLPQIDWGEAT